jgi:alkaline phosphatase D
MRSISRRGFLTTSGAALAALPWVRSVDALAQVTNPVFRHGVASGDPLSDRVILWTRVTPAAGAAAQSVSWELARDEKFTRVVTRGELQTGAARDFTVKVDAVGLEAGTTYYYRFQANKGQSPVGRTRTLPPNNVSRIRLGVVSCSNLPQGYFNAYACLANRDVDAVLHLGDYFYEYANKQYGDGTALGRIPAPDKEIISLQEYRERHAQYKADPDSQKFIAAIRSSSSGTITSSRTTRGGAAQRITRPRPKATGRSGAPRRSSPITSGCRSARTCRR